ncbi:MAG TPA: glycosyl hydrolase family 8 [Polyangiaceae bacterium]|nr:glycosyl hydrolase family 8 [Polyangiaceae bacterium]
MTLSGPYCATISSPFAGVAFYGNGDTAQTTHDFATIPGEYKLSLAGASSTSAAAQISVRVSGTKVGSASFTGTTVATQSVSFTLHTGSGAQPLAFVMETDNGSSDLYLQSVTVSYVGAPPAKPQPPSVGAFTSGVYRNLFAERGYAAADIEAKVDGAWNQLFNGQDGTTTGQRVYYPVGTDMAYIWDVSDNDVRTEGMSYGMMIAVQLDKQDEFNRLWKWAKTYMQHASGDRKGYFAWHCQTSGSQMDPNPASDGEEYFTTALLFAASRWGNGTGIYDYRAEAEAILHAMLHTELADGGVVDSVTNMFNPQGLVVFTPYANAATYTDPSYHLPAFYELWSRWGIEDNAFWSTAASASRTFFNANASSTTGLTSDQANFGGSPTGGNGNFTFDAWRSANNWAMDYAWFAKDSSEVTRSNHLLQFFDGQGIGAYANQFTPGGTPLSSDHSPGLVAMNAVAAIASDQDVVWDFVDELWNTPPPQGFYRYYDGMLYMLGLLHVSGNYRIYGPGAASSDSGATGPGSDGGVAPGPDGGASRPDGGASGPDGGALGPDGGASRPDGGASRPDGGHGLSTPGSGGCNCTFTRLTDHAPAAGLFGALLAIFCVVGRRRHARR